jgi:predicted TPR repeat methyltransferase
MAQKEPEMPAHTASIDPALLTSRVRDLIRGGRVTAARPMLAALRKMAPASPALAEFEAQLLLREGRINDALVILDQAIISTPNIPALLLCRAEARISSDNITGAAADAAEAVCLAPGNAQAKAILGIVLIDMNRLDDALICLREAVAQDPSCAAYRQGLAQAQERAGDAREAASTLQAGINHAPQHIGLRIAAIMVAMRQRDFSGAIDIAEAARRDGCADACVFGLLGHALSNLSRNAEAADAYAEALKLAPEDSYVRHLVRTAGMLPHGPRAPNDYLEAVFDGYAERFEAHLIGLGYSIPGLIRTALLTQLPGHAPAQPIGPILDLGCGTGLVAIALSDLPIAGLVGVDISGTMLQHAAAKNLYTELQQADLETVLADTQRDWAVITAADVFCYFGDLEAVFTAAHARLRPGGLFIFSVESLAAQPDAWQLGPNGRYLHGQLYVSHVAAQAGFVIRAVQHETLRYEDNQPVDGLIVTLERIRHDA